MLQLYVFLFLLHYSLCQNLQLNGNNCSSSTGVMKHQSGRDGRDGRDGLPGLPGRDGIAGPPGPIGLRGKDGAPGPKNGGTLYTRWGSSSCPTTTGAQLIYSGYAGGSDHLQRGGGANYLCMPKVPKYSTDLTYKNGQNNDALVYGSEYQDTSTGTHDHNVPCAVCRVPTRTNVLMIPATYLCPTNWTREYYGYLMAERNIHHRTTFECVDKATERLPGGLGDTNGALFYHSEVRCGRGLPCPPYNYNKELNCVICTM